MKCDYKKLALLSFLIVVVSFVSYFYFKPKEESFKINSENGEITDYAPIEKALKKGDVCFIKFYASWCPHCNSMEQDWNKFYSDFDSKNRVRIYQVQDTAVNVHKEFKLKHDFTVDGFPTIIRLDSSGIVPYEGERNYGGFKEFINNS